MYKFLFNFYYRYHDNGELASVPGFTAILAVGSAALFQLFLPLGVVSHFTETNLLVEWVGKPYQPLYVVVGLAIFYMPFFIYYNKKRIAQILNSYPENYKVLTLRNVLLVFLIHFGPLIMSIFLYHSG